MAKNNNDKIKIIPLGGINEIGKNMTVIEYKDEIIVIDAGLITGYRYSDIGYTLSDEKYKQGKGYIYYTWS